MTLRDVFGLLAGSPYGPGNPGRWGRIVDPVKSLIMNLNLDVVFALGLDYGLLDFSETVFVLL